MHRHQVVIMQSDVTKIDPIMRGHTNFSDWRCSTTEIPSMSLYDMVLRSKFLPDM